MKKLKVIYRAQNDNSRTTGHGHGSRQCNVTANAMMLDYLRLKNNHVGLDSLASSFGYNQGEDWYASVVNRYGDTIYHSNQTKALKACRVRSEYRGMSIQGIIDQIDNDVPTVIGVKYKVGGHIVCVVGYDDKGMFIHDPNGIRNGSTNTYLSYNNGAYDHYSWNLIKGLHDGMGRHYISFVDTPPRS
jgi:uncharacterized protein YvpB